MRVSKKKYIHKCVNVKNVKKKRLKYEAPLGAVRHVELRMYVEDVTLQAGVHQPANHGHWIVVVCSDILYTF